MGDMKSEDSGRAKKRDLLDILRKIVRRNLQ
jgi:hypothetical protein